MKQSYSVRKQKLIKAYEKITLDEQCNPEARRRYQLRKDSLEKKRNVFLGSIESYKKTIESMEHVLANLDRPYCPISNKLTCTTDKTPVKKELQTAIMNTRKSLTCSLEESERLEKDIQKCQAAIELCDKNAANAEKKELLKQQLETTAKNIPELPKRPEAKDIAGAEAEMDRVRKELENFENNIRYIEMKKQFRADCTAYNAYHAIVSLFNGKGAVKEKIIQKFIGDFETSCNNRLKTCGSIMTLRFAIEDGVHILADAHRKNQYLPYKSLSGGEKAMVLCTILSLLSEISGFKILFMDELSIMDTDALTTLFEFIKNNQDLYDHIVLSMVGATDIRAVCKTFSFI